jgi:hypothetical protein
MIDYRYIFTGVLLVYGIYSIRQGIKLRKKSDVALGILCLLGVGAVVVLQIAGIRNR